MCEHHRNIGVSAVERNPRSPITSAIFSTRSCVRSTTSSHIPNAVICAIGSDDEAQPTDLPTAPSEPAPVVQVKGPQPAQTVHKTEPTKAAAPAPVAPEPREPAWFRPQEPKRTGTLPNPNRVPKSQRVGTSTSSSSKPNGEVDVDKLLAEIHSVPARGFRKGKRRR